MFFLRHRALRMKRGHRWIGYSVLLVLALAFVPTVVFAPHHLIAETNAPSTTGLPSAETMESNVESRAAEGEVVLSRPLTFVVDGHDVGATNINESDNTVPPINAVPGSDESDSGNDGTSGPNVRLGSSSCLVSQCFFGEDCNGSHSWLIMASTLQQSLANVVCVATPPVPT